MEVGQAIEDCPPAPIVQGGKYECDGVKVGSKCELKCNDGYFPDEYWCITTNTCIDIGDDESMWKMVWNFCTSATPEPTTQEPTTPEPTTPEPTTPDPTTPEPTTPEPTTPEPTTPAPTTPEPTTPEPTTPEPTTPVTTKLSDEERISHCGVINSIADESITVSSTYENHLRLGLQHSRLYSVSGNGGWCPDRPYVGEWIEIDMGTKKTVRGIATQGQGYYGEFWTKSYNIAFKKSTSSNFQYIQDQSGRKKIFQGNRDGNSVVIHDVDMEARFIRIYPLTWNLHPLLRFDILLC